MLILKGRYGEAKVFTDYVEESATSQIIELLNQPFVEGSNIRIMSDVHAGAGCVIGFTADMKNMVIPNLIGVDIGCGMLTLDITGINLSLESLDQFIKTNIPAGRNIYDNAISDYDKFFSLHCYNDLRSQGNFGKSIGTLGGGNHFIEIDKSEETGKTYLVIHSGSRNMGKQVADYYQKMAVNMWKIGGVDHKEHRQKLIDACRAEKRGYDIPAVLARFDKDFKESHPQYPADLCFLFGDKMQEYLYDMDICQKYASHNRAVIAKQIIHFLGSNLLAVSHFETIHNYIDMNTNIMRKGAVSAQENEKLIIPMNMRDGSLLCIGKGNSDWNYSAPHGAGRLMSRGEAKRNISMDDYKESMKGIFTSSVNEGTLDESPMSYKPMAEIISNIKDTVDIVDIIHPIYNFKAGE